MSDDEDSFRNEITPADRMAQSDRMALERKILDVKAETMVEFARLWTRIDDENRSIQQRTETFYKTRMMPLEKRASEGGAASLVALGAAVLAVIVSIVMVVILIHERLGQ